MSSLWVHLSQLGDSRWLLPLGLTLMLVAPAASAPLRWRWAVALAIAASLTLASKLAFLGWGVGLARLDFTGFSGHATMSAAIYPVVAYLAAHGRCRSPRGWAVAGAALAAAIAWSRLPLNAHSLSEVVSGWLLGAAASAVALSARPAAFTTPPRTLVLALCMGLLMPLTMPSVRTHDLVVRLATELSGRDSVFARHHPHR
jgi:membrane-associated phospholipid phosphatase